MPGRSILISSGVALSLCLMVALAGAEASPVPRADQRAGAGGQSVEESLLLERAPSPMISPHYLAPPAPVVVPPAPEDRFSNLRCRMTYDADNACFVLNFLADANGQTLPPHRVLPCEWLEKMESLDNPVGAVLFRVTGDVASYRNHRYFLPAHVTIEKAGASQPSTSPDEAPRPAPAVVQAQAPPMPRTGPAATGLASTWPASFDFSAFRGQVARSRPGKPLAMPVYPVRSNQPDTLAVAPLPRVVQPQVDGGVMVIDRAARIVRQEGSGWMEARFISDNTLQERPIRLLLNSVLQKAERFSGKVRLTGIVKHYKGQDYLLLRKVLVERDMGQF